MAYKDGFADYKYTHIILQWKSETYRVKQQFYSAKSKCGLLTFRFLDTQLMKSSNACYTLKLHQQILNQPFGRMLTAFVNFWKKLTDRAPACGTQFTPEQHWARSLNRRCSAFLVPGIQRDVFTCFLISKPKSKISRNYHKSTSHSVRTTAFIVRLLVSLKELNW